MSPEERRYSVAASRRQRDSAIDHAGPVSVAIDPDNPPYGAIRDLLTSAFTAEDLRRFCQDRPSFRPVLYQFGPGSGLADMVDRVMDYCRTQLLWDELLAEVASANPRQYARFASALYATAEEAYRPEPSLPPPDVLPAPGPLPPGSLLPQPRNSEFIDRVEQLKALAQALLGSPVRSPTLVWGMPGMGMTELAVEFAYRYGRYFWGVHWLNGANLSGSEVAACGRAMGLVPWPPEPAEQAERTLQAWREGDLRLVIVDGLEDVALAQEWLPRLAAPSIRLLITARRGDWPQDLGLNLVQLGPLSLEDSQAFLRTLLPAEQASDEELDRLAAKLGGLPLALRLAGRYLARHDLPVADYLKMLAQEEGQDVRTSFAVLWEQVTDEAAQRVLRAAAWCAPSQPIPDALLQKATGLDEGKCAGAIDLLVGLSLLERAESGLEIRPPMAEYVRSLPPGPHTDEGAEALRAVADALVELSDRALETALPAEFSLLRPHVEAVAVWAEEAGLETAGTLWSHLGAHRRMVADYAGARTAFERALRIDEQIFGPDDATVAGDVSNLGDVLRDLGDLSGAQSAFERVLDISEQAYGPDHPSVGYAVSNVGVVLEDMGDLAGARAAYERALEIGEKVYGPDDLNIIPDLRNLGKVLYHLDDLAGARAIFERALEIGEKVYGSGDPTIAEDLRNLGMVLYDLDDVAGAQEVFERALVIDEKALGPSHPLVAADRDSLAMARYDLEGLVEACLDGSCVLFAGSGLSERAGLPGWEPFVEGLRAWAVEQGYIDETQGASLRRSIEAGDASLAADSIASTLQRRGHQAELNLYLARIFGYLERVVSGEPEQPTEIHQILAGLPLSAALTPNHDRLLEGAFKPSPTVYTPSDADSLLDALSKREPFLLKLRGTLDRPDTVMLSPTQYQDALASNRSLEQFMSSLLVSRTILFLGTSLDAILTYCGGIKFAKSARQHYAIVPVSGSAWEAKAEQLRQRYNVQVLTYRAGEVDRELSVVRALARRVGARAGTTPPDEGRRKISRLKTIRLENIGPFRELSLDLDAHWNVLLGDNGMGKSTILKALALAICGDEARPYADRLVRIGTPSGQITLETTEGGRYVTKLSQTKSGVDVVSVPQRPLEIEGWLALGFPPLRGLGWQRSAGPQPDPTKRGLSAADLLPLLAGTLDPRTNDLKQWIVNVDYQVVKGQDQRSQQLFDDFFDAMDGLTVGMKFESVQVDPKTYQVTVETDDGQIPIELVSQGTQSLLGWVGVLLERMFEQYDQADQPRGQPALVLIDEIDAHMHPLWQREILPRLSELFPEVQFIATTHSPLIVGGLPPTQIVRLARDPSGRVVRLPIEEDMALGRADQLLTSEMFGLETTLDKPTEDILEQIRTLSAKTERTPADERILAKLRQALEARIPVPQETPAERRAQELLHQLLESQLGDAYPEVQESVRKKAEQLFAALQAEEDKRR